MFTETHKKNWAKQHPELLCSTPNRQFESKMKLSLERVSKITPTSVTTSFCACMYIINNNYIINEIHLYHRICIMCEW